MKEFSPTPPAPMLDGDGYPTRQALDWIEAYDPRALPLIDFAILLRQCWWMPDWGYCLRRKRKGKRTLELHTGGWSGNEEVIRSLRANRLFFSFTWQKSYAGGHHYFSIPIFKGNGQ